MKKARQKNKNDNIMAENSKTGILNAAPSILGAAQWTANLLGIGQKRAMRQQVEQQGKLNEVNAKTAKELADYEQQLKLDFRKSELKSRLDAAEEEGVSRVAVLGGAAAPGSGATVSGISGGSAANAAEMTNAQTNKAMAAAQLGLMVAQTANINADTKQKEAGTENLGADTTKKQEETKSLSAGIENTVAKTRLIEVETKMQEMQNEVFNDTMEDSINTIKYTVKKQIQELGILETQNKLDAAQYQDKVEMLHAQAIGTLLANNFIKSQTAKNYSDIRKNNAEMKKIAATIEQDWTRISQGWVGLSQSERNTKMLEFKTQTEQQYPGIWNVAGRAADDLITEIVTMGGLLGERKQTKNPKK